MSMHGVHMCVFRHMCVTAHVCWSEDNSMELIFSFLPYLRGSQDLSSSPQVCAENLSLVPVVPNVKMIGSDLGKIFSQY